jgi:hypothetical protein
MLSNAARCANNAAIAESEVCGLWADYGRNMGGLWADCGRFVAPQHYSSTCLPCRVCLSTYLQLRVCRFVGLTLVMSNSRYCALDVTIAPFFPPRISSPLSPDHYCQQTLLPALNSLYRASATVISLVPRNLRDIPFTPTNICDWRDTYVNVDSCSRRSSGRGRCLGLCC